METTKIEILIEERKTKEGKKFNTYKTFTKNGRKIDLKFRADVKNLPTEHCMGIICVDDINVDTTGRFPVAWVSAVQGYESIAEARKENNRKKVQEYFG